MRIKSFVILILIVSVFAAATVGTFSCNTIQKNMGAGIVESGYQPPLKNALDSPLTLPSAPDDFSVLEDASEPDDTSVLDHTGYVAQ